MSKQSSRRQIECLHLQRVLVLVAIRRQIVRRPGNREVHGVAHDPTIDDRCQSVVFPV